MSQQEDRLMKEWLKLTKPRITVYNKYTDMEICFLCGVSTETIGKWWLLKFLDYKEELRKKIENIETHWKFGDERHEWAAKSYYKAIKDILALIDK